MTIAAEELTAPLEILPPVDFCCAYGSSLLSNNKDKGAMVDYILGVADPLKWHSENLQRNRHHYASWMACLGPKAITRVADGIGVGVHFNPFVLWKDKMIKYGVVGMQDLTQDVLTWDRFYLSGRLQKPVQILVDNYDIEKLNAVNLKAAVTAALLLSPLDCTEEDLYSQICSLSYTGDLRMLFAEDKNKVKKIVQGSFSSFQALYKPFITEHIAEGLLKPTPLAHQSVFKQDCGLPATIALFSSLPWIIQRQAILSKKERKNASWIRENGRLTEAGRLLPQLAIASKEEASNCVRRVLRRLVMVSSTRQAISGVLAAGGINAIRYLGKKMSKAWRSQTS